MPKLRNNVSTNGHVSPRPEAREPCVGSTKVGRRAVLVKSPKRKVNYDRIYTAREIMAMELPEPRCVVHGMITEGLNLLVSRPKLGKSWLGLQAAIAVATGKVALGSLPVDAGNVLYLAMEDNLRRLKSRLTKLLNGKAPPERLQIVTKWPLMDQGGLEQLVEWAQDVENPRLIVLDTVQKVRSLKAKQGNQYADDYRDIGEIQSMVHEAGVSAILGIHHDRKAESEDVMDDVSGSIGITAAADTILLLRRGRNQLDASLYGQLPPTAEE